MAGSRREFKSSADSTLEIMVGWNLSAEEGRLEESAPAQSDFSWTVLRAPKIASAPEPGSGKPANRESTALYAGFNLDVSAEGWASTRQRNARTPAQHSIGALRAGAGASEKWQSAPAGGAFPKPGEELAGFRVLLELGRGAFARVYLAEERNLGGRLVAIKVSQPQGDEPQNLARLQHTHIVPVHSVCDDPASGLRILCMPFFGGANLAQVLEAAGRLVPSLHGGRSLVEALDQVSQSPAAVSSRIAPARTSVRARPSRPPQLALGSPGAQGTSGEGNVHTRTSRFRSLFSRLVRHRPPTALGPATPQIDQNQPSRQFLHGASAIQAAVWIMARLAEGLEHAHLRGLLHRDLKPSNILLAGDGTPMLLDFNLAADLLPETSEGEFRRAMVGGTLPYMSPEHLDAFNPRGSTAAEAVDERSDIYAMGLILFEILAGEPPFPDPPPSLPLQESIELLIASRRETPSLKARCAQIPWSLDALAAKCLCFDPAGRYASAGLLAEDLRRYLEYLPMKHCPEPSVRERLGKAAKRHPVLFGSTSIALIAAALVGLVGSGAVVAYEKMQDLRARVRARIFDRDFAECQFLLNTADNSDLHLKQGIKKSRETLAHLGLRVDAKVRYADWLRRLLPEERRRIEEQVAELFMLDAHAHVVLASRHGSEGDRRKAMERAIAQLGRAERIGGSAPSALYAERAQYHAALGDAERARRDRKRAERVGPATCRDLTLLGRSLLASHDLGAAEDALRQALRLDVTSFWTWFVMGHCHYAQGRFLEAAGDFGACTMRNPGFPWTHFNRGLALARSGRLLDAKDAYNQALELEPDFAEALVNRALVALELNQLSSARDDLNKAIDLGRRELVVWTTLGETMSRLGQRTAAERRFAALLASNPDDLVVRVARGITRIHDDPGGARADFARVLTQDPRHAQAHYGMALLARKSNLRDALEHLEIALQSDPNLIDAVQLRALVRARLGDRAALDDVDRLIQSPTPSRLYNAACAVAVYADKARDARPLARALGLLKRALESGVPASEAATDPDLKPLEKFPEFRQLMAKPLKPLGNEP